MGTHRHVVIAFITSVVPPTLEPTDLLIDPSSSDFAHTGLRVRSALRLHRLVTVSAGIIQRQLGLLPPNLQRQVRQRLGRLFGL
jgi:mRNA interferase MazF